MIDSVRNAGEGILQMPVSANITPLTIGGNVDPHVWLSPKNVVQWVENIEDSLSALDPANAAVYERNADSYQDELADLMEYMDEQIARIPEKNRRIVTNHDALGYFSKSYGIEIVGTVIPAADTLAEPSARGLSQLVNLMESEGICTIFAELTANDKLAQAVTKELENCPSVQVLSLYTGAIGPIGSAADSYTGMMKANVDTIVQGSIGDH